MVAPNAYGVLALVSAVPMVLLAWTVYSSNPTSTQNRRLAFVQAIWAVNLLALALLYQAEDPSAAWGAIEVVWTTLFIVQVAYVRFLATLDSPFGPALRHRWVDRTLLVLVVAWPLVRVLAPIEWYTALRPAAPYVTWRPIYADASRAVVDWHVTVLAFAVITTLLAFRRTRPGSLRRRQMGAYLTAAAVADGATIIGNWLALPAVNAALAAGEAPSPWIANTFLLALTAIPLVYISISTYGILKTQMFDVDLKIKWSIKQSTVAAAFLAVFFIVSESAAAFFSGRIGTYVGILAAGALVFAIVPLQRLAERVADAAMPRVTNTPQYLTYRKLEVYRHALENAMLDGTITTQERDVLDGLRHDLGILETDAQQLERDVMTEAS